MGVSTIKGLCRIVKKNSCFSGHTVHSVILNLGFNLFGNNEEFKKLSSLLTQCSLRGADTGFSGFINISETISFFIRHRKDIINHMEQTAADCGMDIISMVQNFGIFKNSDKPSISDVGKALWDKSQIYIKYFNLYNVFSWYALEEIAHTWQRYLENNPAVVESLLAKKSYCPEFSLDSKKEL